MEFKQLKQDLKISTSSAFACGTNRNLRIQWESFILFCLFFNFSYLPASTNTLQLYAQFLSRSFKSVNSIRNYISGVRTLHFCLGFSVDHINNYLLNLTLRGLSRLNPHAVKKAEPITIDILLKIFDNLDFSDQANKVFWCLFLFAFFLVARKSNLVPTSKSDIEYGKYLKLENVQYFGEYILVSFHWTKTIQFGEREVVSPLLKFRDHRLCPVSAFEEVMKLRIHHFKGALFTLPNGTCITYHMFQRKLRSCIENIGLNPSNFSTHSFRRGFTTLAFKSDIPPEHIQLMGDWKSDSYKCYLELNWSDKAKILRNMFQQFL